MKVESYVLLFVGFFFGIVGALYWLWSHEDAGKRHAARDVPARQRPWFLLPLVVAADAPRPSDDPEASLEDGAGVVGAFPGSSVWPFVLGVGATFVALRSCSEPGLWGWPVPCGRGPCRVIYESRRGGLV